jgi:hypothetical protein
MVSDRLLIFRLGCTIQLGIEVCTVPSERYNHGSVMHEDGTLYVYGGFSQRCQDYCDDIWFFDIYLKVWLTCAVLAAVGIDLYGTTPVLSSRVPLMLCAC